MSNVRRLETPSEAGAGPMPDRPGSWWILLDRNTEPEIVRVLQGLRVEITGWDTHLSHLDPRIRWLAPIPGPAVCAALAKYGDALDDLDALWDGADFITRNNVTNRFNDAGDALHAAIRAERDGDA